MSQSFPPYKPPVQIVCTSEFSQCAASMLNPAELRALYLLLGDETRRGEPVGDLPGMRGLDYAGNIIYYMLPADEQTVFLLRIERVEWSARPVAAREQKMLRTALSVVTKSAIVISVRDGVKWLWDFIVH